MTQDKGHTLAEFSAEETVGYRGTEEGAPDSIWEQGHLSWTGWVVLLKDRGQQPGDLLRGHKSSGVGRGLSGRDGEQQRRVERRAGASRGLWKGPSFILPTVRRRNGQDFFLIVGSYISLS